MVYNSFLKLNELMLDPSPPIAYIHFMLWVVVLVFHSTQSPWFISSLLFLYVVLRFWYKWYYSEDICRWSLYISVGISVVQLTQSRNTCVSILIYGGRALCKISCLFLASQTEFKISFLIFVFPMTLWMLCHAWAWVYLMKERDFSSYIEEN